jgi:prolyl-tRNA synthetase
MAHGDDDGLRVPPVLAPIQVVVLAVKDEAVEGVHRLAMDLRAAGLRVRVDDQTGVPFGRRAVDWELKGVPLRVELGPRDIGAGQATVADRLFGGKQPVALNGLVETVVTRLAEPSRTCSRTTAAATPASPSDRGRGGRGGGQRLGQNQLVRGGRGG